MGRGGERQPLAALLEQALLALALADLHQVVLPAPPPLVGVHRHLVAVPADLRPRVRPERHRRGGGSIGGAAEVVDQGRGAGKTLERESERVLERVAVDQRAGKS